MSASMRPAVWAASFCIGGKVGAIPLMSGDGSAAAGSLLAVTGTPLQPKRTLIIGSPGDRDPFSALSVGVPSGLPEPRPEGHAARGRLAQRCRREDGGRTA